MQQLSELSNLMSQHINWVGTALFVGFGSWQVISKKRKSAHAQKSLKKSSPQSQGTAQSAPLVEPIGLHPEFDRGLCISCGTCTAACPEGKVIQMIQGRPELVSPGKCVGHGECERVCPQDAISLVFGTRKRGKNIPRITANYESNVPGLYIAGELGGMGLIRNAIKQGTLAAQHALGEIEKTQTPKTQKTDVDLVIVGAGPAGLAAALSAIEKKKSYLCIEQGSFGGTVYNYPRQKIVMTLPAQLPVIGIMKFRGHQVSKEELLEFWQNTKTKTGLVIQEQTRFEKLVSDTGIFRVTANGKEITAKKVILAMGVRGTPRKLGIPNEDLAKVAYQLIDADQYQDQDIAIVGAGNSALEAAQSLAEAKLRNRVTLLVRGDALDRANEKNIEKVSALVKQGRITILYRTSVSGLTADTLLVKNGEGVIQTLPNHFLLVLAGTEMPDKLLTSLGIQIDTKFGETLGKGSTNA